MAESSGEKRKTSTTLILAASGYPKYEWMDGPEEAPAGRGNPGQLLLSLFTGLFRTTLEVSFSPPQSFCVHSQETTQVVSISVGCQEASPSVQISTKGLFLWPDSLMNHCYDWQFQMKDVAIVWGFPLFSKIVPGKSCFPPENINNISVNAERSYVTTGRHCCVPWWCITCVGRIRVSPPAILI